MDRQLTEAEEEAGKDRMGLPLVVTLVTTGLLALTSAEPREQFVFRLLSVYAAGPDQATGADRDKNDKITDTEFLQSLFFFTDEKRDRRVTQAEFVDGYRRQFGLPSELLVIMFDLLDDLNDDGSTRQDSEATDNRNNEYFDVFSKMSAGRGLFGKNHQNRGDGILTPRDVTVRKFIGESKQSNKEEYRKSLMKWVAAAADRLYSINYQPHIPGNPWDMEFDYEKWFHNVDRNNDSLITFKELSDEFRRYFPDGRVKRLHWVSRNLKEYRDKEWLSNVVFDYWDKNKDLRLDDLDVGLVLREADRNRDTRVTTIEFHRFMEKYNKRARRRLATPVRPVMYDCPSPWWQSFGCRPRVDATRAAMDMDDNFDGWITQGELRKRVSYYDRNGDGWASRMEVMMLESMRYGVPGPAASVMFDVYDRNSDGRFDIQDVQHMLSNGRVLCFCDARRAIMDLVKLSEKFQRSPQARGPAGSVRNAMRWQMKREWQWRQQTERLWHSIWGQGGPGGTCREGDCTGKDWRGGAWYSPFDWRQKNRVPENFLQWSYLRDIPRTITSPRGFGTGSGPFFPGGRPSWWNPQGFRGDGWYQDGNPSSGGNPSGGMGFPSTGPSGPRQFPSGSDNPIPMPPNFMPNPSKISSRSGNFPATSNNVPFMPGNFPPALDGRDNSAEEFWNSLLAGLDNDTGSEWDPEWMKLNMNAVQKVFNKDQNFPQWTQMGRDKVSNDQNMPRDWKSRPDLSNTFRNSKTGTSGNSNLQVTVNEEKQNTPPGGGKIRGLGSVDDGNRGRQRPSSGNSRFRREASETSDSATLVSPVPLPPSPTTNPVSVDTVNSSTVHTDRDPNSTLSVSNDHSIGLNTTESSIVDQPTNQNTTEVDSDDQSTSSDTNENNRKISRKDETDKIGRSSAWLRRPFAGSEWQNHYRNPDCDTTEPWNSDGLSGYIADPRGWDETWQGLQDQPLQQWPATNPMPMSLGDTYPTLPREIPSFAASLPLLRTTTFPAHWWKQSPLLATPGFGSGGIAGYPNYPPKGMNPYNQHQLMKRSTGQNEETKSSSDDYPDSDATNKLSRMMGGYNSYWPRWWHMWNNRYGSWQNSFKWNNNNNQWNYNQFSPYYLPSHSSFNQRFRMKRSPGDGRTREEISSMMGGYGGYWPQWWNMWNNYRYWPGNWNNHWMWNSYYPFYFSEEKNQKQPDKEHVLSKRSAEKGQASRMMGGYGGHWPQWWNMWNNYGYWPDYWNNYSYYPFYFSEDENKDQPEKEHIRSKRSTDKSDQEQVSRMMGGYGGYWPQWWNMWNNYRYWPGYWNNNMRWNGYNQWNTNKQWNHYNQLTPYQFSSDSTFDPPVRVKRNADSQETREDLSRMMGGYGGYWPQQWNMWNNYRYWPGYWNNYWMWSRYYPFYFSEGENKKQSDREHIRSKRSTDKSDHDQVSRMMGGYGGYWPQWWNMWPGYWKNNFMWNNYNQWDNNQWENYDQFSPYYFSSSSAFHQPLRIKRSADDGIRREDVSRMMGGYGGYWPRWWNMWRSYRYWPGYWNHWNWNSHHPFYFSESQNKKQPDKEHILSKRSTAELDQDHMSRMMRGYNGYRPQWWNMWNNNRYWPGYWNHWNQMWNNYYPFYFSEEKNKDQPEKEHILSKRSADKSGQDQVSRMMGGYGIYWPHWWSMWNKYRHWPTYWNRGNWMWNSYYPFYFFEGKSKRQSDTEHILSKRSTDKDQVSKMMGGYSSYRPQWWNMWNNYRDWPGFRNNNFRWNSHNQRRNFNQFYPSYFFVDRTFNQPLRMKRSTDDESTKEEMSRMMGGYWPQWWNMWSNYRYWPGYWNNYWMWNSFFPFHFSEERSKEQSDKEHILSKRSTDKDQMSRMMGGYGSHWPQWWNMWNGNRYWPGYWNHWNWMWNRYYPFYFSEDKNREQSDKEHILSKRSTDQDKVSRMMGGHGSRWPQWWNMWNNYRYWPGYWKNNFRWNSYNQWDINNQWKDYSQFSPYHFYSDSTFHEPFRMKRSPDDRTKEEVSKMMAGYGSSLPQRWNMWNYRYWPGYWNNWNWMRNHNYPFYFSEENKEQSDKEHIRLKRNARKSNKDQMSRMMGGYGGHWPQWWNNYRYWPGYWNHWNWMWHRYYPFYFSEGENKVDSEKEHILFKRSTDKSDQEQMSRMMGGYGGYWPQWWNVWNNYRYWPGHWNSNLGWNSYNQWNTNKQWNHYTQFTPYQFSADSTFDPLVRKKRNTDGEKTGEDVSRMMGGYSGHWPRWWNMWNNHRYWPGYWNQWNWMWNNYYPFYFSEGENKEESDMEHILSKRSTDKLEKDQDQVSRMMGGFMGYWPQWWNMWNNYRYWPGYWNHWKWMWSSYYPFYFSEGENQKQPEKEHILSKRSTEDQMSRMMGGYNGYWPQWWNMWNNYRYWPGYWNNNFGWNSHNQERTYNRFYPFYLPSIDGAIYQPLRKKRSTDDRNTQEKVSRMMGGYGGYWPQWWNTWNNYRYWPGYWNWMWNRYYPVYFSEGENKDQPKKQHILLKRSADKSDQEQVSRMMGGYGGYWPQWWNMWSNYRFWPGYWNNNMNSYNQWNTNKQWNRYNQFSPYQFSADSTSDPLVRMKRNTDGEKTEEDVSRMMGGYRGHWPRWWNMNDYRYWPGYRNHWNWMWNNYYPFYFSEGENKEESDMEHILSKRSTDKPGKDQNQVSRMMGGYMGYWPQWWNMWNNYRYWPGYWNHWNWMWSSYYPFYFSEGENQKQSDREHILSKRSTDQDQMSRMMGGYGGYWPQWWNMWSNYRYRPGYWNNNMRWNSYNQWNINKQWDHYNQFSPYQFSADSTFDPLVRMKRNTDGEKAEEDVSRMMGSYRGYWPRWWNMNDYRYWPGYWNWMWNNYYPFYFSEGENKEESDMEHILSKRSTDKSGKDQNQVSRMMGGYMGYWPQWWTMWNNYRYWPDYRNNNLRWNGYNQWNTYKQWNRYNQFSPYQFSAGSTFDPLVRKKRNTDGEKTGGDVSRMMGGYSGYWPRWWNMWNNYRYWPGYWNQRNWMWNNYYPFYFSEGENKEESDMEHILSKRSADQPEENQDQLSRMMGGYMGYWPQWWNNHRHWPGYWNHWNWMWSSYYPFYFSEDENQKQSDNERILSKRSADKDQVSRMMGGYGGHWPQWWNMWNNYRYRPGNWNNHWMWNSFYHYYPSFFHSPANSMDQEFRTKRSVDTDEKRDEVSKMMGGYGNYQPQWWNNHRYWPRHGNGWNTYNYMSSGNSWNIHNSMWSNYFPFQFTKDKQQFPDKVHVLSKRSMHADGEDQVSRMMGGYGGYWPQWWNMWSSYRYGTRYWNGWNGNNFSNFYRYYPFYATEQNIPMYHRIRMKRSVSEDGKQTEKLSRMMNGYGGYWPQWWNMLNYYRYWPGYWNNWSNHWMWRRNFYRYYPFFFSQHGNAMNYHSRMKRHVAADGTQDVATMMGAKTGHWPPRWHTWNNHGYMPGHWNMWNRMQNTYYSHYFSTDNTNENMDQERIRPKRSTASPESDEVSRMTSSYDGSWPQLGNMWNNYRYWPGQWNNWNWMWNSPGWNSHFFAEQDPSQHHSGAKVHIITERDVTAALENDKMAADHQNFDCDWNGLYMPGDEAMWNNQREWPLWMWNFFNQVFPYHSQEERRSSDNEDIITKRSVDVKNHVLNIQGIHWPKQRSFWNSHLSRSDNLNDNGVMNNDHDNQHFSFAQNGQKHYENDDVVQKRSTGSQERQQMSRMMNGHGGYRPQRWNAWNNYRYWPGFGNDWNANWNRNVRNFYTYYPFFFSTGKSKAGPKLRVKRRATEKTEDEAVSSMMGGYGGHWPRWWSMWNNYRYWPGYWNHWNSMWNSYYPFYFSEGENKQPTDMEHILSKRSTDQDQVSRMMGGYGGYWPQWWSMWNNYRFWSGNWNGWYRMGNSYPFYFLQSDQKEQPDKEHLVEKRSAKKDSEQLSRMMGGFSGYSPQQWNMWDNYRYWPAYQYNWNSMWNSYYPFYFSTEKNKEQLEKEHILGKRSTDEDKMTRMMGGSRGYWPGRYNHRQWPRQWNNWMWNSYFPFYFSRENEENKDKEHFLEKRSTYRTDKKQVSRMMGGYWPQRWSMWNSYKSSPGYWNAWNGMWNRYNPFYFSQTNKELKSNKEHVREKRNTGSKDSDQLSRMMSSYGDYWPQWQNMWNNRYWPGAWNSWMWNSYNPFYFSQENKEQSDMEHVLKKRSSQSANNDQLSRMMGGFGGYRPQWWNMWNNNRQWPGHWDSNRNWNGNWMWSQLSNSFPFSSPDHFQNTHYSNGYHTILKRNADESNKKEERVAYLLNGFQRSHWPEQQNTWQNSNYQPYYWNSHPHWRSRWNVDHWMWNRNRGRFPGNSFFYQQNGNPDFPPASSYQQQSWNTRNNVNGLPFFLPSGFSQDENGESDDLSKKQREKRSSESVPSVNKTAENTTDISSTNDTGSTSEPGVARQMTSYGESSGNPYLQQWLRLYRTYLNTQPRFRSSSPYFRSYEDPYFSFYRRGYSNRYGHYYIRYIVPWRVYQNWLWQMWNRMRTQNQMWGMNDYDRTRRDYAARSSQSPYPWGRKMPSSNPNIGQPKNNAKPEEGDTSVLGETTNVEEKRTKRTIDGMNYVREFHNQRGNMFDYAYHSPSRWNSNMHNWWDYMMYNYMLGQRNGHDNWVWSRYKSRPFMFSHEKQPSNDDSKQEVEENTAATHQNKATTINDSSRSKRSTEEQSTEGDINNEQVSRWMRIPDQFLNQPSWHQNNFGKQISQWMRRYYRDGLSFFPEFMNRDSWRNRFMPTGEFNQLQDMNWKSLNDFSPFHFSEKGTEIEKHERQKRSAEEAIQTQSGFNPKVSRSVKHYPPMPSMTSVVYPWPVGWQYQNYNSQSQWRTWNTWGEGKSWDNWNAAYSATFPSYPPFNYASNDETTAAERIRQKRNAESSPDIQKENSKEISKDDPEVSRMDREFGLTGEWRKHRPSIVEDRQWMKYRWPMFDSSVYRPWGSTWKDKSRFPPGQSWNQNQFYPQWDWYKNDWYKNTPSWHWRGNGRLWNANKLYNPHFFRNEMNPFNKDYLDESVFDPLSSYYFSNKDTLNTDSDEKLKKSVADKTFTTDIKTTTDRKEEDRSKRSLGARPKLLSEDQAHSGDRQITFETMLKPNRRFIKRNVPYKMKRFSPEATARLEKRFQKRSSSSDPESDPTDDDKLSTKAEEAPKMAMRATAPARGQSTRDREWGPPSRSGFPPQPSSSPQLPDRNEIPNRDYTPNQGAGQAAAAGEGTDPFRNMGNMDDWNWDQPGWSGNPNWAGEQGPGSKYEGQNVGNENKDLKGPQGRDGTITATTSSADSEPGSNIPSDSIVNGDSKNRLSNYNYIDFNNPNYWNQFYNPSSYNTSAGDSLGNATQWHNWFGLWAYGPNFWDDMNDLDLWDAPWGSGSWGFGPGGDQWNDNWSLNPGTGFSSALPVEIGWESYWLDDCDEDGSTRDSGYRPWNTAPIWVMDVVYDDALPSGTTERDCGNCFRPYAPRYQDSFRPIRYNFRPSLSVLRPSLFSYQLPRFFRPSARPRGSPEGPWYKRFPGYPWDSYGKAKWSGFPWWGWNPNSFWNPWRYRIQYHNNADHKVSRSRRGAVPAPPSLNPLGTTSTSVHKLAPTAATINSNPQGSPVNTPSLPSGPFNNQGLVGPKQFPGKPGPSFYPSLVGPYSHGNDGAGWGFGGNPTSGSESSAIGNGWTGLPWWDKNNWHVKPAGHDVGRFPDQSRLGPPRNIFNGIAGGRNFPAGLEGTRNFPAGLDGARYLPTGFGGPGNVQTGLEGVRNFPTGLDGPRNFPTRLGGPENFPVGLEGARNFPAGLEGARNFPAGLDGPRNFPAGMGSRGNVPVGPEGARNFPAGLEGARNFPAGLDGPRNFPAGMGSRGNFPVGPEGARNFPTGLDGPRNFPTGLDGPRNFPAGLDGPRNFPAGLDGPRNFPAGLEGGGNFPVGPEGLRNFPAGMGQGRPPPFPQHTNLARPATPWRGGQIFRPPGEGFYPGPLRQESGQSAEDVEAGRNRQHQTVTSPTPWNPSPWNKNKFGGKDGSSDTQNNRSGPSNGNDYKS